MTDDADDDPLADLAAAASRRREARDDDVFAEAFEDTGTDVDSEAVWATLAGDDGPTPRPAEGAPTERVVDKQSYCHRCPHFADPPEMACTREGTEIVELVDSEHVRVRDCPVVAEREELEGVE